MYIHSIYIYIHTQYKLFACQFIVSTFWPCWVDMSISGLVPALFPSIVVQQWTSNESNVPLEQVFKLKPSPFFQIFSHQHVCLRIILLETRPSSRATQLLHISFPTIAQPMSTIPGWYFGVSYFFWYISLRPTTFCLITRHKHNIRVLAWAQD